MLERDSAAVTGVNRDKPCSQKDVMSLFCAKDPPIRVHRAGTQFKTRITYDDMVQFKSLVQVGPHPVATGTLKYFVRLHLHGRVDYLESNHLGHCTATHHGFV